MADLIFDKFPLHVMNGNIDLSSDVFKIALVKNTYTPDSTDELWSEVSTYECDATGYTAGGKTISNVSLSESSGVTKLDFDDPAVWLSLTGSNIYYAVVYDSSSSNRLCCLFQFSAVRSPSAENLALVFSADGLLDAEAA